MKRRFVNFVSAIVVLLAIVLTLVWVRSWYTADEVVGQSTPFYFRCISGKGRLQVGAAFWNGKAKIYHLAEACEDFSPFLGFGNLYTDSIDTTSSWHGIEFVSGKIDFHGTGKSWHGDRSYFAITIPDGDCVAALALVAAIRFIPRIVRHRLRRQRAKSGACLKCGYDLRATPDCCPECGTIRADVETPKPQL